MIEILTNCSIIWLIDGSFMYVWPCKYPRLILNNGIIKRAKEIDLMTNVTSLMLLPPVKSPTINRANTGAKVKHTIKDVIENILIAFVDIWNIRTFLSSCFKVAYSLVNLLIARGIPADDIIKKINLAYEDLKEFVFEDKEYSYEDSKILFVCSSLLSKLLIIIGLL